jgi:hypothetical protein
VSLAQAPALPAPKAATVDASVEAEIVLLSHVALGDLARQVAEATWRHACEPCGDIPGDGKRRVAISTDAELATKVATLVALESHLAGVKAGFDDLTQRCASLKQQVDAAAAEPGPGPKGVLLKGLGGLLDEKSMSEAAEGGAEAKDAGTIPTLTGKASDLVGLIGAVATLVQSFQSEEDVKGKSVTVTDQSFVALLVRELLRAARPQPCSRSEMTVLYPPLQGDPGDDSSVLGAMGRVDAARAAATTCVPGLGPAVAGLTARRKAAAEAAKGTPEERRALEALAVAVALEAEHAAQAKALDAAASAWATLQAKLLTSEGANPPTLARVLVAEEYRQVEGCQGDACFWILHVDPVWMGGNNRVRKSIWTPARISHSGAAVVSYVLTDEKGKIVAGDTLASYEGYYRNAGRRVYRGSGEFELSVEEALARPGHSRPAR